MITKLIQSENDYVEHDISLQNVLDIMTTNRIKYLVLLKDKKPFGIITERDILFLYAQNIDFNQQALNFAKKDLIISKENRRVDYILSLMINHNIRRVIITDSQNNYLGCILQETIIYELDKDIYKSHIKVSEIVKTSNLVLHVQKDATIQEAIEIMAEHNIGSILIYNKDLPVGIITESDIIDLAQKHVDTKECVEKHMHAPVITFDSDTYVYEIVNAMKENNIRRVVIYNNSLDKHYIVTSKDLLNNIKGNYGLFLESKLTDAKNTFNSLNEAVIEVFINDESEHTISWFNSKATRLFDLKVDDDVTKIIPKQRWKNIYEKIENNESFEEQTIELKGSIYQLTILHVKILQTPIIKLLFTNISELVNKTNEINSKYNETFEQNSVGIVHISLENKILDANKKICELLDYKKDNLLEKDISDLTHKEDLDLTNEKLTTLLKNEDIKDINLKKRCMKKDGSIIWVSTTASLSYNKLGKPQYFICFITDITLKEKIKKELILSDIVFENTTEGIIITNEKNKIVSVNKSFTEITGYNLSEIYGKNPRILKSGKNTKEFYTQMWQDINKNGFFKGEIWNRKKNGEIYAEWLNISTVTNKDSQITNYVAIFSDITKIKDTDEQIEYLAHHDPLTNLPNKLLLNARLEQSIERANNEHQSLAVLFIDIDNFKLVNDSYGHTIGDRIINLVSLRLQKNVRKGDTISRIGGDEFVIVIEDINKENTERIAQKIIHDFTEPIKLEEYIFDTTITIGISLYPNNGISYEDLIKHADTAMHSAKAAGKNQFQFYKNQMTSEIFEKVLMKQEIKNAIEKKEFEVYFQPQIDTKTKKLIGAEALVRWNHKDLGVLSPINFIPHAEDNKLIIPLGEYILDETCAFIKKLHSLNIFTEGKIAVNISGEQIKHSEITKTIVNTLNKYNIEPKYLEVEVTETFIMEDVEKSIAMFKKLKEIGVSLSIDDFGTGYSSLNYIKQFPIDKLKIDKSFVDELPNNNKDIAIAKTVIALAKGLELKVIAEGVENKEQEEFLASQDCDEIQGWLYSKALRKDDFIEFCKKF